jgi:hypothetical protein
LNAYNALAMYGILRQKIPRDLSDASARARFFRRQEFALDGRARSLEALETQVLRPLEDPRVAFALNRMTASSPQLPPEPFRGADLNRQLEAEVQRFFAEARNLRVEEAGRVVRVSGALQESEWEFTRTAGSLVAYVNRYRTGAPLPADSRIEYIPYDWTVRSQP